MAGIERSPRLVRRTPLLAWLLAPLIASAVIAEALKLGAWALGVPRLEHAVASLVFTFLAAVLVGVVATRRLAAQLRTACEGVERGAWSLGASVPAEIADIERAFAEVRHALADRAHELEQQQSALVETNTMLNEQRRKLLRVDRERRAGEALIDRVVDALPDPLVVVDAKGRIRVWGTTARAMFGHERDAVHRRVFATACFATGACDAVAARVTAAAEGATAASLEVDALGGDGRTLRVELTLARVATPRGPYVAITIRDVADARAAALAARQAEKLQSVGRLAAGIAHEINTPIQFIGDSTRFVKEAWTDVQRVLVAYRAVARDGAIADEARAALGQLEADVDLEFLEAELPVALDRALGGLDRVATIVRTMKEFAHPDGGARIPTDLNRALTTTLTVAQNEIKYVAEVETDFGEVPMVPAYPGELNQVFLNILVNAAHAIQDSGKFANGARGTIRVATRRDGDGVVVSIADNGCGIDAGIRERIFDPFFTTKEVGRGTGQGLAIAHGIVCVKHGGMIDVDSSLGVGTTFRIRMPATA